MCYAPVALKKPYKSERDSRAMMLKDKFIGGVAHEVPCGRCPACLKRRQKSWVFRLREEMKVSTSACFITLTYENENLPLDFNGNPTLDKRDTQLFMKRLRKKMPKDVRIKYYLCGEYGSTTKRPHYHAIMFNLPPKFVNNRDHLSKIWNLGIVSVDPCNMATITYVTKYISKGRWEPEHELDDRLPEFSLMSKKLGLNHLTPQMIRYYRENEQSYVVMPGGEKQAMPRYFRDRVFSKDDRIEMNVAATLAREEIFEKEFNNDHNKEYQWKIDQYRKALRKVKQERQKL